jgi:uncharacterized coiled-coil DUF342 family protein
MKIEEAIEHCYEIAKDNEQCKECKNSHLQLARWLEELVDLRKLLNSLIETDNGVKVESNIFDKEKIIENCTVQILENSLTGEVSVGWWRND